MLQLSRNSHCKHPAGPPHTMHDNSFTWAHFSCLTPIPLAHKPISLISIFSLHTTHVPGNFIGILRQLILATQSPFQQCRQIPCLKQLLGFYFLHKITDMGDILLQMHLMRDVISLPSVKKMP